MSIKGPSPSVTVDYKSLNFLFREYKLSPLNPRPEPETRREIKRDSVNKNRFHSSTGFCEDTRLKGDFRTLMTNTGDVPVKKF